MIRGAHARLFPAIALLLLFAILTLSGCGGSNAGSTGTGTNSHAHCGFIHKLGVGLHLGIAYVAFKKGIYDPWKKGEFNKGAPHRVRHIVVAVGAGLLAVHEARKAIQSMLSCGNAKHLSSLLAVVATHLGNLRGTSSGTANSYVNSQIATMNRTFSNVNSAKSGL